LRYHAVSLCCGARGGIEQPRDLEEAKDFARCIILDKPIPEWYYQSLDELREVESSVTVSHVTLCKSPFFAGGIYLRYE
jgi:hypothetical protein